MLLKDSRGLPWTVSSEASGRMLLDAITGYFTFRSSTLSSVDQLLEQDPECPMGWVLRGYLLLFARSASLVGDARIAYGRAQALASRATRREIQHIGALQAWIDAETLTAQTLWSEILADAPHDLLALRVQHFNAIFLGRPHQLANIAERTLADWSDDIPGAGFAWSTACMGLEEVGFLADAERIGRRGAELEPDDLWAVHSVAHVMEAEGRLDDGLQWMKRPDTFWEGRGPMRHHLWWHEALFLYEAGEYESVVDYYHQRIAPLERISYMEMSNAASLLLRLEGAGVCCSKQWDSLAGASLHLLDSRGLTFSDVHLLFIYGMAQDSVSLQRLTRSIASHSEDGTFDAEAAGRLSVPLAAVFAARQTGDHTLACDILSAARAQFARMGGSNAQRDVLDILLVDCATAAGKPDMTLALINEYLSVRPESVPMRQQLARLEAAR